MLLFYQKLKQYHTLFLLLFFELFFSSGAHAASYMGFSMDPKTALNNFSTVFNQSCNSIVMLIVAPAKNLLFHLISIDIIWTGINWVLDETDLQQILGTIARKILYFSLLLTIINSINSAAQSGNLMDNQNWLATIPNSFSVIGDDIAHTADTTLAITSTNPNLGQPNSFGVSPGAMLERGINLAFEFLGIVVKTFMNFTAILPWNILANILLFIMAMIVSFFIILMFALLAADMMVSFIEAYITMTLAVFLVGLSGSRWTVTIINIYVNYMFGLGLRILISMAVYAINIHLLQAVFDAVSGSGSMGTTAAWNFILQTLGMCFVLFAIVKAVPDITAGMMSNSPMLAAGSGLKSGISGILGGMSGAAVTGQVLGAGVGKIADRLEGKKSARPNPKGAPESSKKVSTPSPPQDKHNDNSKDSGKVAKAKATAKTFLKNNASGLDTMVGNGLKTTGAAFKAGFSKENGTGKKGGAKAFSLVLGKSVAGGNGKVNTKNVTRGLAATGLRGVANTLTFGAKSIDGRSVKKDKNGKIKSGGNIIGKSLGSIGKKAGGSEYLSSDKQGYNYTGTFSINMPE